MKGKKIRLYANYEPYYGVSMHIWTANEEEKQTRGEFIEKFKKEFKNEGWLQEEMNVVEVMDFLDTLSNDLNGENLYKNLINNFYWLEELQKKAYVLGLCDRWKKTVTKNVHSYSHQESLSLFSEKLLTPYLKNNKKFKEWFANQLKNENEDLYLAIFDSEENKKTRIARINEQIKNCDSRIKAYTSRYERDIKEEEEEKSKLQNELNEINKNN